MKFTKLVLIIAAILVAGNSFAQKVNVTSGNLKDLAGVEKIKIVYDYSNLGVGKFKNEDDYIAKKMADAEKSKPGTGDAWKAKWFDDRQKTYQPKFEDLFNKTNDKITAGANVESDVVMNVHTTYIEPGFNVGVTRQPAYINLTITITKNNAPLAVVEIIKAPGQDYMGFDYDAAFRISEAYAKAAKVLSNTIKKATK